MRRAAAVLAGVLLAAACLPGCRGIEADTLFVRGLPGPPGEDDWSAAVPLRVMVAGGTVHQEEKTVSAQTVDRDTVHVNSASCHHGPSQRSAFPVWLRGYHDRRNIYLRVTWPDLTRDEKGREWVMRDGSWRLSGGGGDGLGLIFPLNGSAGFTCALVCHLDDWTVRGGVFREAAKMHFAGEDLADVWLWRAELKETLDLFVDAKAIRPDSGPEPFRKGNSVLEEAASGGEVQAYRAFSPDDHPRRDGAGRPLPEAWRPGEGARLPAYLPLPAAGRGSNISTSGRYRGGLWEITLTRPLSTGDPRDVVFASGGVFFFGLSVLDDTLRDHHIIESALKMNIIS